MVERQGAARRGPESGLLTVVPQGQAPRKWRAQSCNHKELNSANNLKSLEAILPQRLQVRAPSN